MPHRESPSVDVERIWTSLGCLERSGKSWSEVVIMVDWAVWLWGGMVLECGARAMVVGMFLGQGKGLDWIGRGLLMVGMLIGKVWDG